MSSINITARVTDSSGASATATAVATAVVAATGWISITPSVDTNTIYISASGVDAPGRGTLANPILSLSYALQNTTVGTLGKGVRNGFADHILCKCGDIFPQKQSCQDWKSLSGRSPSEPIVVGSYGAGPRPQFKVGGSWWLQFVGGPPLSNWMFDGIEIYANTRDPASPDFLMADALAGDALIQWVEGGNNIVFQDMLLRFGTNNISVTPGLLNGLTLNRCIIVDAYNCNGHSQGLFASNNNNTSLIECLFDHNGWNEDARLFAAGANGSIFSRNYYQNCFSGPVTCTRCISANSASEGAQFRSGGTIQDNLFIGNSSGFDLGHGQDPGSNPCPVITATDVAHNVIMNSRDIQDTPLPGPRGFGANIICSGPGTRVHDNIIAHLGPGSTGSKTAVQLDASNGAKVDSNIIYDWGPASSTNPFDDQGTGSLLTGNAVDLAGLNTAGYPDPKRTIERYDAEVLGGPGTRAHFLQLCRQQSKQNWRTELGANAVNNWIRAGFRIAAV